MRRFKQEITDPKEIDSILEKQQICRLAINTDDFPYIVPLNYGYHDNSLYFHCAKEGRKIDLLKQDNRVGFEIEGEYQLVPAPQTCDWSSRYASVIGTGSIEFVEDEERKTAYLDLLMRQHGATEIHFSQRALQKVMVLKLTIENLTAKRNA